MEKSYYALSKRGGGFADMGVVTDGDFLYRFEISSPEWVETIEIIFEESLMVEIWNAEWDLWVILQGPPPADEPLAKQLILAEVFVKLTPLALIRTIPLIHLENVSCDESKIYDIDVSSSESRLFKSSFD